MRHDKLERELNMLLLLTENHDYTVDDVCSRLHISRRNFYYYLEFFRFAGFKVEHHKPYYRIRKDSPFFRKLDELIHFTEDEAITLRRILDQTGDQSLQVQRLRRKLEHLYDLDILNNVELKEHLGHNLTTLYNAIKQKVTVKLIGYSSLNSNSVSDRIVEPFLLMNGNEEVRCYELSSKMNKTFKLSRMQDVQPLDLLWQHEDQHNEMFTDIFMFSAERQQVVSLLMGRVATSILCEEYPRSERYIQQKDSTHWQADIPVSSFVGIGRFVMGLFEDIEILDNNDFKNYIHNKINQFNTKQQ